MNNDPHSPKEGYGPGLSKPAPALLGQDLTLGSLGRCPRKPKLPQVGEGQGMAFRIQHSCPPNALSYVVTMATRRKWA